MNRDRPTPIDLIFPTWPDCDEDQIAAAERVLRSGRLNYWTGDEGKQFEREFARYVGVEHAVAVANGTAALELALGSLGVSSGDEVVVPARTFVATASAVVRCGATPIFADVDRESQNITAETIRPKLSKRTKAVIAVHMAGWPCDLDPIRDLAKATGLALIEDCAQAHGACYNNRPVGSLGDIAAFSFCQDKIMTTAGEGGMVVTNNTELWKRAWSLKDHGKDFDAYHSAIRNPQSEIAASSFRYVHNDIGTNWRMTEVQSAIGRIALRKLDEWVAIRRRNADILSQHFAELPLLRVTPLPADYFHSYYKYYTFIRPKRLAAGWSRDRILAEINAASVPCFSGQCPEVYREKAFANLPSATWHLPIARELGKRSLMFQVHPTLTTEHMEQMANVVCRVVSNATN